jgi:formylglycine-generating enzyme required for sulfatase activity
LSGENFYTRSLKLSMKHFHGLLCGFLFVAAVVAAGDRFTLVMGGAAVVDNTTGLVWEQSPGVDHVGWSEASDYCLGRRTGGRGEWRVPTKEELASLVDRSQENPALPDRHPFANVKSAIYWTSTPDPKDRVLAWHVSFFTGQVTVDGKHLNRRVWCVRDQRP